MPGETPWLSAQVAVLGSMLIEPRCVGEVMSQLRAEDFNPTYRTIFAAVRQLWRDGQAVDPVAVTHALGQGYAQTIVQLMEATPTAANVSGYIAMCRDEARLAALQELGLQLSTANTYDEAQTLAVQAAGLTGDARSGAKHYSVEDLMQAFYRRHLGDERPEYLPWPFEALERQLYIEQGDMVVLGGYPSAGKTMLALQMAALWSRAGKKVGFFTLETSEDKLFDRFVAAEIEIPLWKIKKNLLSEDDVDRLAVASTPLLHQQLEVVPAAGMTVDDIRAKTLARRYDIILVDYLQIIRSSARSSANRTEVVAQHSMGLHTLAQQHGVTVVALSQLTRQDKQTRRAPDMSDLRESGQIEQDADAILLLYLTDQQDKRGPRTLDVVKNKEGETGTLQLAFDGAHQRFAYSAPQRETKRRPAKPPEPEEDFVDPFI